MITQTINLNLIPGAVPPRVNVTQYDEGSRTIVANLYNGTSSFTPSAGTTAKVKGTKPDKHGFEYDATISGRTVEIDLTQQMSCVAGDVPCEVELTLNDEVLGTGTFVLRVKASALADDTDISETELPDIIDAARSSAASAAASAEAAQEAANSVSVEYTTSGNPISVSAFPTEATTSMTISPTQNLHGYDKPWAGGAGKNKLPLSLAYIKTKNTTGTWSDNTYTLNDITYTVITNDGDNVTEIRANGTATANAYLILFDEGTGRVPDNIKGADIILSGCPARSGNPYTLMLNSWGTASSIYDNGTEHGTGTFPANPAGMRCEIEIYNEAVVSNASFYPMIALQSASNPTTFEPYSNICPITGITTATVQTTDGETTNEASMALGETVYGGSVDFNAGTGTVTRSVLNLGSLTWTKDTSGAFYSEVVSATKQGLFELKCTCYADLGESFSFGSYASYDDGIIARNATQQRFYIKDTRYTDATALQTALSGQMVTYELATPTSLSLTPDTLTMLNGDQTVSGNGETVTLTYDGNVKQYIDTKVPDAPTTDGTYTLTCVVSGGVPTYSWT